MDWKWKNVWKGKYKSFQQIMKPNMALKQIYAYGSFKKSWSTFDLWSLGDEKEVML